MVTVHALVSGWEGGATDRSHAAREPLTPRHFLEAIGQYVAVHEEKSGALRTQRGHLERGLARIEQTRLRVRELQETLREQVAESGLITAM